VIEPAQGVVVFEKVNPETEGHRASAIDEKVGCTEPKQPPSLKDKGDSSLAFDDASFLKSTFLKGASEQTF